MDRVRQHDKLSREVINSAGDPNVLTIAGTSPTMQSASSGPSPDEELQIVTGYRAHQILVRSGTTGQFESTDPGDYHALIAPPNFAQGWGMQALKDDPKASILTASLNACHGCPIGEGHFCGRYCFAWQAGHRGSIPIPNLDDKYRRDMIRLQERKANVGIFFSYDGEPLAGEDVIETTKRLFVAIMEYPPESLLLHTRTAHAMEPEVLSMLRDVSKCVNLIVGVAIETDEEDLGPGLKHYHSVEDRFRSIEAMANAGIQVQGTTTPMVGFHDYPGVIRRMAEAGVSRIMYGKTKHDLKEGGAQAAHDVLPIAQELGLHIPTEDEAAAICAQHDFPGGAHTRERFYVSM